MEEWDYESQYPRHGEDVPDPWDEDDCARCGPWCQYWAGDGLCLVEIHALYLDERAIP